MENRKGFTLVELIIVIAIIAIIMLIGTLAYARIQERMKVRADRATCAQIGKALRIRETDIPTEGIELYPKIVKYDSLSRVDEYVSEDLIPQSMPDGCYIVTAVQTQYGKKIIVGIGKPSQEICLVSYYDKTNAGWVWSEDNDIEKFLDENKETMKADNDGNEGVTVPPGVGNTEDESEEVESTVELETIAVGSYIQYSLSGTASYTVGTSESGYANSQTFNPSTYTGGWKVLKNDDGQIDLISAESIGNLTLYGVTGYAKSVKTLNDLCSAYVNSSYATSGRCFGSDSSAQDAIAPESVVHGVYGYPYIDSYNYADVNSKLADGKEIWIASRWMSPGSLGTSFYIRSLYQNGFINENTKLCVAYYNNVDPSQYEVSRGVCPIISLKSSIKITGGSGTSSDPYKISK